MWTIQKNAEVRLDIGIDSGNVERLQISWNRRVRDNFYAFITELMGFSQS